MNITEISAKILMRRYMRLGSRFNDLLRDSLNHEVFIRIEHPYSDTEVHFHQEEIDERRQGKANDQIEKFYEIFRDLSFEISFTDALMLMPKFASTLKTLIGNKEKLSELARTPLNENCSAVILNKLPKKLGDPGRFLIPCEFTGITTCNALADLGASIITIAIILYGKDLALPELTPTCMTYRASRSFQSLNLIDVYEGEITLRVGKEPSQSKPGPKHSKYNSKNTTIMTANKIDGSSIWLVDDYSQMSYDFQHENAKWQSHSIFCSLYFLPDLLLPNLTIPFVGQMDFVYNGRSKRTSATPFAHLEYAFLEGDDKLPVIIAKDLKDEEKAALLKVLKSHKRAIAWKLSDIKGVSPEFCTHKILIWKRTTNHLSKSEKALCYTDAFCHPITLCQKDAKAPRLMRWILLLQEFDIDVRDKKGAENLAADHLSRLENPHQDKFENKEINEAFPLETLGSIALKDDSTPWFADFANYHAGNL
ncbi:hypothetical protein Tco_0826806 [Tanacetum coccineum]